MDPAHLKLAEIGLRVAGRYGFALAGGYAVQIHGILERPSEDVDLFTAWDRRDEFAAAVEAVISVVAALVTGRYTREQLLGLAEEADAGFDRRVFADLVAMMQRYPDRRFAAYGVPPERIAAMRERFAEWHDDLVNRQ
ncbi:nucleotidyl transferase AbiEii/AbiGii toxin family protein [Symbioplanes lichenis]|uniref:nucleotidyl transferase AbiEii/AbiGii toxin family protein n=1 Tax=Symbioplanes lichenis TaxID=1629072 RepID=UPI0027384429|nr:nucleotidyl transferase AbiEii/AbiGii toxin family protein [Actinoplanes lichenis]